MTDAPLFDPADFLIPEGICHVCAGGETAFLKRHEAALARYARDKSAGFRGRDAQEAEVAGARNRIAAAWGVQAGDIGLVANVAEGMSMLVESIDWQPGDSVVLDPDEYPSLVAPLALQRHPQVQLRFAPAADIGAMLTAVDHRTRLIAVSHVSYLTGARYDLAAMRQLADSVGAMLVVDHTQAAGYLPIATGIADFAFSAAYKWLLGMTGVAVAYWNRARQPEWLPASAGWYSIASMARPDYSAGVPLHADAGRFTRGNPAHGAVYVLNGALDYLARHDAAAIAAHVQALTVALHGRLRQLGLAVTTPADPSRHGASICFEHPRAAAIVDALAGQGIFAWNGRGRIRFSFHGYNGMADVERIAAALRDIGV